MESSIYVYQKRGRLDWLLGRRFRGIGILHEGCRIEMRNHKLINKDVFSEDEIAYFWKIPRDVNVDRVLVYLIENAVKIMEMSSFNDESMNSILVHGLLCKLPGVGEMIECIEPQQLTPGTLMVLLDSSLEKLDNA